MAKMVYRGPGQGIGADFQSVLNEKLDTIAALREENARLRAELGGMQSLYDTACTIIGTLKIKELEALASARPASAQEQGEETRQELIQAIDRLRRQFRDEDRSEWLAGAIADWIMGPGRALLARKDGV